MIKYLEVKYTWYTLLEIYKMKRHYIYSLSTKHGNIFYVGLTDSFSARLSQHKGTFGKDIIMRTIVELNCTIKKARNLEKKYIQEFLGNGHELKNIQKVSDIKIMIPAKVDPDIASAAKAKASRENISISSKINYLLKEWVLLPLLLIILFFTSCATQNGCQQNRNFIGYHSK